MTVYAKIENDKLICANNNLGITGLADSPELCLDNGFIAYTEEQVSGYFSGTHKIIDGVLTDISNTPEYIAEQKANARKIINLEYVEKFNAFDIMWSKNIGLGKKNTEEYVTARANLVAELKTKLGEV